MSRRPTKAADNPFCKARIAAAKYNEKLFSKECASEQLGISVSTLSDYELGLTKVIPPDMVIKMADLYKSPELKNVYCREMCPLGCDFPKIELVDLDRITVKALATFRNVEEQKERLLDIAADGVITEDEKPDFEKVIQAMDELATVAFNLKAWAERNLE